VTTVEFRVLGPLECLVEGRPVPLGGPKRQAVLAALLLAQERPLSLARLIDSVWDGTAPVTAGKQVRNAVSDLRRLLTAAGPVIRPAGDGYRLELAGAALDLATFTGWTARARRLRDDARPDEAVAAYRSALGLWRGPGLAGLDSRPLRALAAGLDEQRLEVLEECAELELRRGRHRSLVGELSELVAQNPLRERQVAQLMVALCRSGAPAQALTVYERTRRTLAEELGVSPGPALRQLHARILSDEFRSAALDDGDLSGGNTLPGDMAHFTGRTAELARLAEALRQPARSAAPVVVVIDGMAGVGKTALAVHAAHHLAGPAVDRLYVDLRAHRPGPVHPAAALGILLRGLGLADRAALPPGLAERSALWRRRLAGRRALIVLDDAAGSDQVRPLLPGTAGCLTVVTSRRQLTDLDCTDQISLSGLSPGEGRAQFDRLVGDGRPAAEPGAAAAVVEHCCLHPAAIHAAAARLRHRPAWTVGHLARRLADGDTRLAELDGTDGGLVAAFERSYELLSPPHQRLFRLLGQLRAPEVDPTRVAGPTGLPVPRVEQLLEDLVDVHLLQAVGPSAYRMHGLLRLYARGLATGPVPVPAPGSPAAAVPG
jgi:DNA-binding SARP family transcriptional activator